MSTYSEKLFVVSGKYGDMVLFNVVKIDGIENPKDGKAIASHTIRCMGCQKRYNIDVFSSSSVSHCPVCGGHYVLAPGYDVERSITDKEQFESREDALSSLEENS